MNGQVSLSGCETSRSKESDFLFSITPTLRQAVETHGGPAEMLGIKSTKSYTAVYFGNLTAFRLRLGGKSPSIFIPAPFRDAVPSSFVPGISDVDAEAKYFRVDIDPQQPLDAYTSLLIQLVDACVDRYPKEWDCCSRYMKCSDARVCVHPDKSFAMSCGYRKILGSGRVFYGKNRNID